MSRDVAAAPAIGGSTPGCFSPGVSKWEKSESGALFFSGTEVPGGTRSFGEGLVMPMGQSSKISGWDSGHRRSVNRLPRRTNIKTVFWYCDEPEAVLSWRSKYFQHGPDREPLKVRLPDLPDVFVVSIQNDNTGRLLVAVGRLDTAILMRASSRLARRSLGRFRVL